MDPFAKLPSELNQQILIHIADFAAVENLISASSQVHAVFRAQPSIIHDLILANPITGFPEIQRLCYNISLIPTSDYADLAHYQQACVDTPNLNYMGSLGIIRLAAGIQRLACACLSLMQQNFASTLSEIPAGSLSGPLRAEEARKPFSWIEEYRTYWSLFHLQHYSALRNAATERWNWPAGSLQSLDAYNVWNEINNDKAEQIWTIAALLSDLGLTPSYGHHIENLEVFKLSKMDTEGAEACHAAWEFSEQTPIPFFHSFKLPSSISMPIWSSPPIPPENEATTSTRWQLAPKWRSREPMHVRYFQNESQRVSRARGPSFGLSYFRPWRRLGLVIWDSWRMYSVGLCYFPSRGPGLDPPNPDGSAWDAKLEKPDFRPRWLALVVEKLS
ncbi:hypothetical protein N7475_009257 [Penicillium sp. IBT 31633x]|nr:hypothetical protein N7475_009257 [Penicillium sp. IBT 31633x]